MDGGPVPTLTPHAIPSIYQGNTDLSAVLQCIGTKPYQGNRHRLAMSDGEYWTTAFLATQLNRLVDDNEVGNGTYLRLLSYTTQPDSNPRCPEAQVIVIVDAEVMGYGPAVGAPKQYREWPPQGANGRSSGAASYSNPSSRGQQQGNPGGQQSSYGQAPSYGNAQGNGYGGAQNQQRQGGYGGYNAGPSYGSGAAQPGPDSGGGGSIYGRPAYGAPQANTGGGNYGAGGRQNNAAGYGQPAAQPVGGYGQAPNFRANGGAIARAEAPPRIVPIASLNAYQNRWTIKAKVSVRSDMRRWSNAKGEGKFFTVDLLDGQDGEIRAIAFNDQADQFYDLLEPGRVFTISKASLKPKKPGSTYNQTRHDHEITLERATLIEPCDEDAEAAAIPDVLWNFKRIEEIENLAANTHMDVIGVLDNVEEAGQIQRRDGSSAEKRNLTLRDDSNKAIDITLWGDKAANPGNELEAIFRRGDHPIVGMKSLKVGDFNGKTLSTLGSSVIQIDPQHPRTQQLRSWFDLQGGANMAATKLSNNRGGGGGDARRCTISAIKDESLGVNGATEIVQVMCYVSLIRQENMSYPACPLPFQGRACNKKLQDQQGDGQSWFCDRCQQEAQPMWRYILTIQADDHTGHVWLTAFEESGTDIIGKSGTELRQLEESNPPQFEEVMLQTQHKAFVFKVKVHEESWNDETRIKQTILRAEPVDYVKESRILLDYIGRIGRGEPAMPAHAASPQRGGNFSGGRGGGAQGFGGGYGATTPGRQQPMYGGYGNQVGGNANNSGYGGGGGYSGGRGQYKVGGGGGYGRPSNYGGGGNSRGGGGYGPGGF